MSFLFSLKKQSGKITKLQCNVTTSYTFIDYLRGGCELSLMVAIDFTASNLSPADPKSLHYNPRNPDRMPNEYERAIKAIGSILSNYDSNWRYSCYGFGGVPTWTG